LRYAGDQQYKIRERAGNEKRLHTSAVEKDLGCKKSNKRIEFEI